MVAIFPGQAQHIPADLYEAMLSERMPGERMLWCGRPDHRRVLKLSSALCFCTLPATINGLTGLLFPRSHYLVIFTILNLLLVAIGGLSGGAPFYYMRRAKRTAYAVTDRRLLSAVRLANGKVVVTSYIPAWRQTATCVALKDGSGDLFFVKDNVRPGGISPILQPAGAFIGIPNVRAVEKLVHQINHPTQSPDG